MNSQIAIFYGSSTSNTEYVAYELQELLSTLTGHPVDIHNIGHCDPETMQQYEYLIFGIPTWDIGELQADWNIFWPNLKKIDLSAKQVAIFGLGDQYGYPDTFQDAMGILAEEVLKQGADLIGYTDTDTYEFEDSVGLSVDGDKFMGLALDEDNQHDLTQERLKKWAKQILEEFGLVEKAIN